MQEGTSESLLVLLCLPEPPPPSLLLHHHLTPGTQGPGLDGNPRNPMVGGGPTHPPTGLPVFPGTPVLALRFDGWDTFLGVLDRWIDNEGSENARNHFSLCWLVFAGNLQLLFLSSKLARTVLQNRTEQNRIFLGVLKALFKMMPEHHPLCLAFLYGSAKAHIRPSVLCTPSAPCTARTERASLPLDTDLCFLRPRCPGKSHKKQSPQSP